MLTARDVMTTDVVTVSPETPVREVAEALVRHRISAVPVVEDGTRVIGIISEGDLLRRVEIGTETDPVSAWKGLFASRGELARQYVKSHGARASDVMTSPAVSVGEKTELPEIAVTFAKLRIKRVPVIRSDALVGIVSRADLMRALVTHKGTLEAVADEDDRAVQQSLWERLRGEQWFARGELNIVVIDGVAQLWGVVYSDDERNALRVAAETTPGVRAVEDHLATAGQWGYA